jgi:hypothetical protein
MKYLIIIVAICINGYTEIQAQVQRDKDLITLKNGYQLLGYVIEQVPGKHIRIYRDDQQDTLTARYEEIAKLTKIWVEPFSEKVMDEDIAERADTIRLGRYNNKMHVFSATYNMQLRDIEKNERRGFGLAYYRNFENKWWSGLSVNFFRKQNPSPTYGDWRQRLTAHSFLQYQFMLENKIRLSFRPQNKRFSTMLAANIGYAMDFSENNYSATDEGLDTEYEELSGALVFQSGLSFRVNPDNQSGFIVEPGITYFSQVVKQYSADKNSPQAVYLGYYRQVNALLTLKLSYFF